MKLLWVCGLLRLDIDYPLFPWNFFLCGLLGIERDNRDNRCRRTSPDVNQDFLGRLSENVTMICLYVNRRQYRDDERSNLSSPIVRQVKPAEDRVHFRPD